MIYQIIKNRQQIRKCNTKLDQRVGQQNVANQPRTSKINQLRFWNLLGEKTQVNNNYFLNEVFKNLAYCVLFTTNS